jgi:hypothetical protein
MTDQRKVAEQLLDAQVEYILGEVSGERLAEVVARDVDDLLAVLDATPVVQLVHRDDVKATAYLIVDQPGGSELVRGMVVALGETIYQHTANDEHHLGDIVDREQVQALVRKVIGMRRLHEEIFRRLSESPTVATVASWFVTRLVSDVMQQNRQLAEKVPGVSSLLSLGDKAANRVRGATSRHFDEFVGDLAGKGAQAALRRLNNAIQHTVSDAPLEDAAMEVWDLQAEDKISGLRDFVTQDELGELSAAVYEIWLGMRGTEYFRELLGAGIDVFFDLYGGHSVSTLLGELDVSRDDLVREVQRFAPAVVDALRQDGRLEALIRARLEPFFYSDAVLKILERA